LINLLSLASLVSAGVYTQIWEPSKEVPSNAYPDLVTAAERQGATGDKHVKEKPTKPKTKSSGCLCIYSWEFAAFYL
jgi:hypothetical protein